jgi:hypothetical protein
MIIVSISIIYQVTIVLGNYKSLKFKVLMEGSNFQINFLEHPISENPTVQFVALQNSKHILLLQQVVLL